MTKLATRPEHETIARWFFIIVSVATMYIFWRIVEPFALVLMTAAVFAVVLSPFEQRIRTVLRNRHLTALLTVLLVFIVIVGPLILAGFLLVGQAVDLVE